MTCRMLRADRTRGTRPAVWICVALALAVQALSCGSAPKPPSLPFTEAQLRASTGVELVELVVDDPARAATVRSLYEQIDALGRELAKKRAEQLEKLAKLSQTQHLQESDVRAELWKLRELGKDASAKYVELRMEIRQHVTPEEFAKLSKVR